MTQVVVQEAARTELCLLSVDESGVFQKCGPVLWTHQADKRWEKLQELWERPEDALHNNTELETGLHEE